MLKPNLLCLVGLVVMMLLAGGSDDSGTKTSVTPTAALNPPALPPSEADFVNVVATAQRGSPQAENDMQRGGIKATRDEGICRVLASVDFRAQDWIGTVTKVDSNSDGKGVLAISISKNVRLQTWNNDLSDIDDNTLIQPRTELFQRASLLKEGQLVSFSGSFIPEREDCIKESSMTLRGKLDDPEFVFRFSSVAPYTPAMPASSEERSREGQQPAREQATTAEPAAETHSLTAGEIQRLTKQRQYDSDLIAAVDGILNAASVSGRVEIYCRFTVEQMEALTGDPRNQAYHEANIDRCKAAVLAGSQSMPDTDALRQKAEQAKQEIAGIDAKMKSGQ